MKRRCIYDGWVRWVYFCFEGMEQDGTHFIMEGGDSRTLGAGEAVYRYGVEMAGVHCVHCMRVYAW